MQEFVEEQYLPHAKSYKRSWKLDESIFINRIKPVWGNLKISEISRQDIELFKNNCNYSGIYYSFIEIVRLRQPRY
jgi:hypothetical protein